MFLGPVSWCLVLFVFCCHANPFLNEVLDDVVSLQLDGIVDWTLQLVVLVVMIGSIVD